jgi:RNA polymerase sigma-70 factor, ECF subfamily
MVPDSDGVARERVSGLLADWASGDSAARERLVPIVYEELRRLAHHYMRAERDGHTLQTTALVNEVYLRLAGIDGLRWRDRAHFFAMAATLMRRVLVDYARQRGRDKRGGGGVLVTSLDENAMAPERAVDVVALDEALERLASVDPQQSRVVELRFFAGLSVKETAEALGISPATVKRDWATAKLWLYNELLTR